MDTQLYTIASAELETRAAAEVDSPDPTPEEMELAVRTHSVEAPRRVTIRPGVPDEF